MDVDSKPHSFSLLGMSRHTQVVHQPRAGDAPEEFLLGIPPGSGISALFLSRHLAWDPSSFHITLSHTPKTHNYFLAFLGDGLAVVWEISTSCSFLRAGRCCLGDWRGAWLSVAAHCCRLFLSLLPSAFFFNAFLLFPDLGRADPAVSPGDCSGFRRIWFQ